MTLAVIADRVEAIHAAYERLGSLREVKALADREGWRTRRRTAADATATGGRPFTRGHLHQILTNPVYAGRIRHRGLGHEGQHLPLIEPARWATIQARLQADARKPRAPGIRHGAEARPLPSPDLARDITEGRQPVGLTSDWIKRHGLPADRDAQRRLIAIL